MKSILINNSETIRANHANISIETTIDNYFSNKITLKDFTTMIAVTIKFVRLLDAELKPQINDLNSLSNFIKSRELESDYKKVIKVNGLETQRRKFYNFISSMIGEFSSKDMEFYFENRNTIASL
jgi:hypothetical protein